MDSTTVNDGPDGDIYCKSCYSAQFGMKGYGYGQGAGTLMSVSTLSSTLGQNCTFYPKIHMFKIAWFTKFTCSKSHS